MMSNSTHGFTMRKATIHDVPVIAKNLLTEGLQDFRRAGVNPVLQMTLDTLISDSYILFSPRNIPAGLVGVREDGCIWMNMTHEARKYPKNFIRWAKEFVTNRKPLLWNEVDIQNNNLRKFLRLIGFKIINVTLCYTRNIYYVEFAMINYATR